MQISDYLIFQVRENLGASRVYYRVRDALREALLFGA